MTATARNGALLAVAATAIAAFVWWSVARDHAPTPASIAVLSPGVVPMGAPPGPPEREAVQAPIEASTARAIAAEREPAPPPRSAPWSARLFVVDMDDRPVANATIVCRPDSTDAPAWEIESDAAGRAVGEFASERLTVFAHRAGVGRSEERVLRRADAAAMETRVVLESAIELHGAVRLVNGDPVPRAKVTVANIAAALPKSDARLQKPAPIGVDEHGRFTMSVHRGLAYTLIAEHGGRRSFAQNVGVETTAPPAVVLTIEGGAMLSGIVVDAAGAPVTDALVNGWRAFDERATDRDRMHTRRVKTGADGRFEVAVPEFARYQLIASAEHHSNSEPVWFETSEVNPHADGVLRLSQNGSIRGRVLRPDGSPFAGIRVQGFPEVGADRPRSGWMTQHDLFGLGDFANTNDAGEFEISVHPRTTWRIEAFFGDPGASMLRVTRTGVAAGQFVEIRCSEADVTGCTVRGAVSRADGGDVGPFDVMVIPYEDSRPAGSWLLPRPEGAEFALPPVPRGREFGLLVTPEASKQPHATPWAACFVGPLLADRPELAVTVRIDRWGEIPITVVDAAGAPVTAATAWLDPVFPVSVSIGGQMLESDGRVVLRRRTPGASRLRIVGQRGPLHEQELLVVPGPNPGVVVRLPAR